MGFADRLKSLFIVEDEKSYKKKSTDKKESAKKSSAKPPTNPDPVSGNQVAESSAGNKGQVTNKFMEILFGAMEKHNLDGFDYLEFKESLKSLEKMPMDEQTRYQSAFAMAKTVGATPEKLINAAQHYLKVLKREEQKFEQAVNNQRSRQVGGRENKIQELEEGIRLKAEHIKKLTREIENDQKNLESVKKEIAGAVQKVETTKNNFIASYNVVVAQIQTDLDNMKRYLG